MGVARRWQIARGAHVVAECGAGKTLIALGMMFVHADGRPFSGIVMAPPHLVEKWARETFLTLPSVRVFLIDDMRNGGDPKQPHGVNEVRLRRGEIVREGLHTTLADMRRWAEKDGEVCPGNIDLHHWPGAGQAGLLLEARLSEGPLREDISAR